MKNTYIIILIVLALGLLFFFSTSNKEASIEKIDEEIQTTVENQIPEDNQDTSVEDADVGDVKEFTISGESYFFTPSVIKVKKGDKVKITFQNTGGFHDFTINEFGVATKQIQSPATEVIEFIADKTGNFAYYCSVGAHRSLGMEGTLVVE